jgi:hypothetical protein
LDFSALDIDSTPAALEDDPLLAVGPATIHTDAAGTTISVLGQQIAIDSSTQFPRGLATAGEYVAVSGYFEDDGTARASKVVRLGGTYSPGNSLVYLRGRAKALDVNGHSAIGSKPIDLSNALFNPELIDLRDDTFIEVLGFEAISTSQIVATRASVITGINGSGAKGINGSGAKGINGSGAKGINGSGAKGINGSGAKGINGSGAKGINGSGAKGINGSGAKGINGSGAKGINGSGAKGINGSGAKGINGSGAKGINGSGAKGINGSGAKGINGSGAKGINGSGAKATNVGDSH